MPVDAILAVRVWFALLSAGALSAGCNGSTGGASCTQVSPCGGNVVGTWTIQNACVIAQSHTGTAVASCPGSSEQVEWITETGTVSFNADMTYSDSRQQSVSVTLMLPQSCTLGSLTLTCSQLTTILDQNAGDAGTPPTCTTAGSGCDCSVEGSSQASHTGTYSINGDTITFMPNGGTPTTATYCVQGNTVYASDSMSGSGTTVTLQYVATKQ
jgi:hypothetical protein